MNKLDYFLQWFCNITEQLLSFFVIIAGFYALWLVFSALTQEIK
jgi:hypothetical protein